MSGLLDLLEIRKAYGDTRVLEGVALSLAPGEVVSLLGPSGCGKSTLLRIAAGLDDDFQGTVERNPILGFGPDGENGRSGGIGVVFQEPRLLPWLTVAQNVGFADGWLEDEHWVERLLADVGLAGCGGLLPKQLSGGMAQRAAIARVSTDGRRCCCSTSRSARSTPSPACASRTCCRTWCRTTRSASCWSPTISTRRSISPTACC